MRGLAWVICGLFLGGCMRLKGVVVEDMGRGMERPARNAVLSVGRPTGIGAAQVHRVNARGEFDFTVSLLDDRQVFLYDGAARPELTIRRVEPDEMGESMKLRLRPAQAPNPMLPVDVNINP